MPQRYWVAGMLQGPSVQRHPQKIGVQRCSEGPTPQNVWVQGWSKDHRYETPRQFWVPKCSDDPGCRDTPKILGSKVLQGPLVQKHPKRFECRSPPKTLHPPNVGSRSDPRTMGMRHPNISGCQDALSTLDAETPQKFCVLRCSRYLGMEMLQWLWAQ